MKHKEKSRIIIIGFWALILTAGVLLAGMPALTQQTIEHQPNADQVTVHENEWFKGAYMKVGITAEPDLRAYNTGALGTPNWNDKISSIQVGSNVKFIGYADINYKGGTLVVAGGGSSTNCIPKLSVKGWDNKISSFKVVLK